MLKRRLVVIAVIFAIAVNLMMPARALATDAFKDCGETKVNTALGCVPVTWDAFVPWLLTWIFGVAGGIAFLLMAYGFILMSTSSGDPKAVQAAQETITSAITGLLVSILALFLLRLIAIQILQIPGF